MVSATDVPSTGPGRPRRAVEEDYLLALTEEVPLDRWRNIVRRAVQDAEKGDRWAREWISRYVLGPDLKIAPVPLRCARRLFALAVSEARGTTVDEEIQAQVKSDSLRTSPLDRVLGRL